MSRKTRKLMWSAPLVAVLAIAGALTMFMTAAPNGAQADHVDLPDQVTGLDATATSRTSVRITWNAPASDDIAGNAIGGAPTGYRIDHSEDNRIWKYLVENTGNADTSFVDTAGITPDTTKHYRVFAINEAGTGPVSGDPVTAFVDVKRTHPPVAPSRVTLTATAVSANQINLSWTAPADDGGGMEIRYDLVHMVRDRDNDGAPATPCTAANNPAGCKLYETNWKARAYEHEELNPSTAYCYRVTAKNFDKNDRIIGSSVSDVVCAVTHGVTNPDPPGAPVAAIVDADRNSATPDVVLLYWLEPDSDGGHGLAFPEVQVQARTRNDKTDPYSAWSGWKPVIRSTTLGEALIEDNSSAGGQRGVGGMRLPDPNKPFTPDRTANTQVLRVGGSDLRGDTTQEVQYRFRIRSKHEDIEGVPGPNRMSGWVEFNRGIPVEWPVPTKRGGDDPPPPPADVTAKAIDGATTRDGQGIRVTWTDGDGDPKPSDYRIDRAKQKEGDQSPLKWEAAQVDTVTLEQWEDLGLKANETWHYRVFPINGDLYGEAHKGAGTVTAAMVSGAHGLLNLRQDSATYNSVTMCWNSLPAAADYAVYHTAPNSSDGGPGADTTWTSGPKTGDDLDGTCYTHEGMDPGAKRWFRVVARDDAKMPLLGTSGAQAIGTALSAGEPVAPLGLVAEVAADSSFKQATDRGVLLLWNQADSSDGNVPTASYTVQRMVNGGAWETIVHDTDTDATHYNDTEEPKAGEQRAYRVAGLSGMGERGVWSNVAYIPAQVIVHDTALGAPTNVMATVDDSDPGSTSVTVTWTNGVNADRHIAVLFDANWEFHPSHIGTAQTDGMVTFENVQPGAYHAVVVSIEDNNQGNAVNFLYDTASVTVGAGN